MKRAKIWQVIVAICFLVILGLVAVTIINGQYLQAVAVSSVGSIFAWFALGAGRLRG
jgi:hypothetical protein